MGNNVKSIIPHAAVLMMLSSCGYLEEDWPVVLCAMLVIISMLKHVLEEYLVSPLLFLEFFFNHLFFRVSSLGVSLGYFINTGSFIDAPMVNFPTLQPRLFRHFEL
ncbi:hypothetical protein FRX31_030433 [Thalictrum thalictroides]|uniref:Uncharacterized protein n=1 Tax=Thalictrum thalictroides TaxID=46969 RepID=A0A7J6V6E5_THATH|nr:hypothetical protein FRX31_030433 [Thalictrum thalictroides]